jgi:enoyl-CoA hydratase/carnithine racemase
LWILSGSGLRLLLRRLDFAVNSALRAVRHEDLLLITLEHPSGLPRLERGVLSELGLQVESLAAAREIVGAVITGSAQAFCAGAELGEITSLLGGQALEFAREGQSVMERIERSAKPVIAAVRGYCMGGGFDLALACRVRVAGGDAVFAHRGAALGLVTGWGGTQRLARLIGAGRTTEILVTGKSIGAGEALAIGLVREIVDDDEVLRRAMQIARGYALKMTREIQR